MVQTLLRTVWHFIVNTHLPYCPAVPFLGVYREKPKHKYTPKNSYKDLYSNLIHDSPKLETTQMDKQLAVYSYNGIILSNKKKFLTHTTTWINVKYIMFNQRSKTQNDTYCMNTFT